MYSQDLIAATTDPGNAVEVFDYIVLL